MKPFTALKFFKENKRKGLMTFIVLILSVCAISLITVLINSISETVSATLLQPFSNFSFVGAPQGSYYLKDSVVSSLKSNDDIEKLMPAFGDETTMTLSMGGNTGILAVFMKETDDTYFIKKLGDTIGEGRMPKDNTNEIVVHRRVMANKKWKLGQNIGNAVNDDENLSGTYKIVGILDGPNIGIIGTRSYTQEQMQENNIDTLKPSAFIIIPKSGRLNSVNKAIGNISKKDINTENYDSLKKMVDKTLSGINSTLLAITVIVTLIIAISVSALMYLIYMQRSDEFGILTAMGYRKSFIRNLIIKEVLALDLISWAAGIVVSYIVVFLLNFFVYTPTGNTINFLNPKVIYYTLIIPVMVGVFSIMPIVTKLRKWDPIMLIERRD